jgi:hypothetical protein
MRSVYTLVLIVVHAGTIAVTLTPGMTKKECVAVQRRVDHAPISEVEMHAWCVQTSSTPIPVSEMPGMSDSE